MTNLKSYQLSLINSISLIVIGGYGYIMSDTPSTTALIPIIFGVAIAIMNPGVKKDNKIIAEGHNQVTANNDPTAHAEIVAIRNACKKLNNFFLKGCDLYTSCEPCPMCLSACYWARLNKIYYSNTRVDAANIGFSDEFIYNELNKTRNKLNIVAEINRKIIGYFFSNYFGNEVHILNFVIDTPFQHRGFGKIFLNKIINQHLKDANVFLEVKRTNFPAVNLYLSFGFQEINIRKDYYSDGEDAIEMVKKVNNYGMV